MRTERRRNWDGTEVCAYCGAERHAHDRVTDQWTACSRKAAWFAREGGVT